MRQPVTRARRTLIDALGTEERRQILAAGRVITCDEGEAVIRAGELGREMFVVLTGSVRVEVISEGDRQVLATLGPGEIFGEIAFVAASVRTADVVAAERVEVLEISREYLEALLGEAPAAAARLLLELCTVLCRRLCGTTRSWISSEALATHDGLTGLANRAVFDRDLDREIARVRRYGTPLSLVVADIDHFKAVNDSHGHLAGDAALRAVAAALRQTLRQVDVICRYGGEEFAVLLPMTDLPGALIVAERLRVAVSEQPIRSPAPGDLRVTISLGVAVLGEGEARSDFFARADAALYASKSRGRNRVTAG